MKPVLEVNNIEKHFDSFAAVRGISFSVQLGEVLGIVGPNGAGKTTTIKIILGLLEADSGSIKVLGQSIDSPKIRQRIGYMPETPLFYSHLTGRELLQLVGSLFQLPRLTIRQRADNLLGKVGLTEAANRPLREYSKGMLQRINLAQAIINEPELLFLDEPMDGLDPIGRIQMKELLLEIKVGGTAIVFSSHILSDVEVMSDQIAIMDKGKILRITSTEKLVPKNKSLEEVFLETIGVGSELK